jgi:hypothetical protein
VSDPFDPNEEEFVLSADPALRPLAERLKKHGAAVVFTKLTSEPDRITAYVSMPADPREADECRQIIADWNAAGPPAG